MFRDVQLFPREESVEANATKESTPTDFVDKMNQNAGNVLSASERTTAINLLGGWAHDEPDGASSGTADKLRVRDKAKTLNVRVDRATRFDPTFAAPVSYETLFARSISHRKGRE